MKLKKIKRYKTKIQGVILHYNCDNRKKRITLYLTNLFYIAYIHNFEVT